MQHGKPPPPNPLRRLALGAFGLGVIAVVLNLVGVNLPSPLPDQPAALNSSAPAPLGQSETEQDSPEHNGAVASSNQEVSRIGEAVLADGGNAVDAAVAMAYAIGVVEPHTGGPGGGGGALISFPKNRDPVFVDFRELSDATGQERSDRFGIPGFFHGMDHLGRTYGTQQPAELVAWAVELAEDGIVITPEFHDLLTQLSHRINTDESVFFNRGSPREPGEIITQPEAADTLTKVASHGPDYFTSEVIQPAYPDLSFTLEDLEEFLVVERQPASAEVAGHTVISAPAPFSGSTLIHYLTLAAEHDLPPINKAGGPDLVTYSEIANTTYAARARTLTDPRYGGHDVVVEPDETAPTHTLGLSPPGEESVTTTHLSVIDGDGMAVSMTLSLGNYFGNGEPRGGFFGNEVAAFSPVGINVVEPYKKVRSFMAPTIVSGKDTTTAIGSPGGNKIPQIIGQVLLNLWEGESLVEATDAPRIVVEGATVSAELYRGVDSESALDQAGVEIRLDEHESVYGAVNTVRRSHGEVVQSYADKRRESSYKEVSVEDAS